MGHSERGESIPGPTFSVIVPVHNDPEGIPRAIKSILSQTFADFEVVVVDDGSTPPATVPDDPRVRLRRHSSPLGPGAARNAGVAASRGTILAFLDSDDIYEVDRLTNASIAHAQGFEVVICAGDRGAKGSSATKSANLSALMRSFTPNVGRFTVRRDCFHDFDDRFLACQDIDWWCRLSPTVRIGCLDTSDHRFVGTAHTRVLNSSLARLAYSYILLELHPEVYRDRRARAFRYARIAQMESRIGQRTFACRAVWKALCLWPSLRTVRVAAKALRSSRPSLPRVDSRPLPPIARSRAKLYRPYSVGSLHTELRFFGFAHRSFLIFKWLLPRPLRQAVRTQLWKTFQRRQDAISCYGRFPNRLATAAHLARHSRAPLETEVLARVIAPGSAVMHIGASDGWYSLVSAARVGPIGKVVVLESDVRLRAALNELISLNSLQDLVHVSAVDSSRSDEGAVSCMDARRAWNGCGDLHVSAVTVGTSDLELKIMMSVVRLRPLEHELPLILWGDLQDQRGGDAGSAGRVISFLRSSGYELYVIDYQAGGLDPLSIQWDSGDKLSGTVLAVPRSRTVEVLSRVHGPSISATS